MGPYAGAFPVVPTAFDDDGRLDLAGQRRAVDFLIDAGVAGVCILANFAEQFSLSDREREALIDLILEQVAGRVPVIVTTSHFSERIAAERSARAQHAGASMVMLMPPYHGASLRVADGPIRNFFRTVADAIEIPIVVQDSPVSGTVLSVDILAKLAAEGSRVRYFKLESGNTAAKIRALLRTGVGSIDGVFDGEESVSLMADLEAGATGTISSASIPEIVGDVVRRFARGDIDGARAAYERCLPLLVFEHKQCGLQASKVLMAAGGILASAAVRAPLEALPTHVADGLVEIAQRLDPLVLRWRRDHE